MLSRSAWRIGRLVFAFTVVTLLLWLSACANGTTTSSQSSLSPAGGTTQGATSSSTTASVDSSTTVTTLAPGVMSFDTLQDRFRILLEREKLEGTLPYESMPSDDVAWLLDSSSPVGATETQGYRLANGDLVILFFVEPATDQVASASALDRAAQQRYSQEGRTVNTSVDGDFGFIVVSGSQWRELRRLALWAREAYPELIYGS
jgi:hypothetical protein